jgi:hypothetical protein
MSAPTPISLEAKTAALFGGEIVLRLEDGTEEKLALRQLALRDYPRAYALQEDELGLTALLAGRDRAWLERLAPESYEALYAVTRRLNEKGFFAWSARQRAREAEAQRRTVEALAALPPETLETAARLGLAATSPTSSPTSSPKPA